MRVNGNTCLLQGEYMRQDGTYYAKSGEVFLYAKTLEELRNKTAVDNPAVDPNINFGDLIHKHICNRDISKRTKEVYLSMLRTMVADKMFGKCVKNITSNDINLWLMRNYHKRNSGTIKNMFMSLIKPTLLDAAETGLVDSNPLSNLNFNDLLIQTNFKKEFPADEWQRLFDFVKCSNQYSYNRHALMLVAETGISNSELFGIIDEDIDFENKLLSISRRLNYDGEYHVVSLDYPRKISLSDAALDALTGLLNQCRRYHETEVDGVSGFICLTQDGRLMNNSTMASRYKNITKAYDKAYHTNLSHTTFSSLRGLATKCASKEFSN